MATTTSTTLQLGAKLPDIQVSSPIMDEAARGMLDETKRLNTVLPEKQAAVESRRSDLQAELAKPIPQAPHLQDVPQFKPREVSNEDLTAFAGIAMVLAGLGTKAMRGDVSMGLNAAGAMMKGFNEGNIAQSKLDLQNFQKSMESVINENRKMTEEYRTIIENNKLSLAQKESAMRVAAAARDDEITLSALKSGQLRQVFDLEAHRVNGVNQLSIKLKQISDAATAKHEHEETMRKLGELRAQTSEHGRGTSLTSEAIDNAASFYILNGRMPIGMARIGQSAIEAIQNRAAEMTKAAGMTPEEFAAAGPVTRQKLGALLQLEKQRNAVQAYEAMLDLNIGILKELSKKVYRTDSPYLNRGVLWLQQNAAGDPDVAEYLFQVRTVQTEAARVLANPNLTGQLTDTATQELANVFGANLNEEQLLQVAERAQADARNRGKTLDRQTDKVISEVRDPLHKAGGSESVQRSKSKSGRPIVSKDGGKTWEYE